MECHVFLLLLLVVNCANVSSGSSPKSRSGSGSGSGSSFGSSSESSSEFSSKSDSKSSSSECLFDECSVRRMPMNATTPNGCRDTLTVGGCNGHCTSSRRHMPDTNIYNDCEINCCTPICFEKETACVGRADEDIYLVPTKCACKPCSATAAEEGVGPNLLAVTCDDSAVVYYDGVLQTPVSGEENLNNWRKVTYYLLNRRDDGCETPCDISIVCTDLHDHSGGILASDSNGLITDATWECSRYGNVPTVANIVGLNGDWPWGAMPSINSDAKWIYDGNRVDIDPAGTGPVVTCSKSLC